MYLYTLIRCLIGRIYIQKKILFAALCTINDMACWCQMIYKSACQEQSRDFQLSFRGRIQPQNNGPEYCQIVISISTDYPYLYLKSKVNLYSEWVKMSSQGVKQSSQEVKLSS